MGGIHMAWSQNMWHSSQYSSQVCQSVSSVEYHVSLLALANRYIFRPLMFITSMSCNYTTRSDMQEGWIEPDAFELPCIGFLFGTTVKPVCNDHLSNKICYLWFIQWCVLMKIECTNLFLLTMSAFWSSFRWPLATEMSSRRQRNIPLGGRYRQVSL